jgi:uncharacterized protein
MSIEDPPVEAEEASLVTDDVPAEAVDGAPAPPSLEDNGPAKPAEAAPVEATARIDAVDVLRGVALLGILAMNIAMFAWPQKVYGTPTAAPGYGWGDIAVWMVNHVVFDEKMMSIFSMLFGAGLVLMSERADAKGASLTKVYYRRVGVLLVIGLIHAYLIWEGDILVPYALCGLFLYPFRRKSATTLVVIGVLLLSVSLPFWLIGGPMINQMREGARRVDAQLAAGETPSEKDKELHKQWKDMEKEMVDTPEKFDKAIRIHRGGYFGIVAGRAKELIFVQTMGFVLGFWWLVGGRMLLGMGLMKLGVFSAVRSERFYRRLAAVGYGVGLPLVICDLAIEWFYDFFSKDGIAYFTGGWWLIQEFSAPFLALGHVAIIMLLYKANVFPRLARRLGAVGRMALTNYLMTSLICTTIFYGYGLGLYGRLHRPALVLVVLGVWAFQLAISLPWLQHFRFGPAEWAWRSLTYGHAQPFRRSAVATVAGPPA